ncbi:MAG: hypothetical protein ABSC37_04685 [Xanthobacteraceae bacterium]|jgi:hypothetical protein
MATFPRRAERATTQRGCEYALLWGLASRAIALRGGRPYSLDRKLGWQLWPVRSAAFCAAHGEVRHER